ncbi:hypothetical protein HGA64_02310 [Candidatus Falkowbacteria bacterium]|nr:hypothetical protein [Candidatus Falkowbacteria bacterium]
MKIIRIKRGFTTNSSGSYEWLPGGLTSSSSTSTNSIASTSSSTIGWADKTILGLSVVSGILAVALTAKLLWDNKKHGSKHKKK